MSRKQSTDPDLIRLNKFIANSGLCSRREADKLIETGAVSVNGKVVTQMGTKVKLTDTVKCGTDRLQPERHVYILLNKPKDYITTTDDPQGRRTVVQLVQNASKARLYPVGRLDRYTTGVLLLTNDGNLTKRLTHPKHKVKKIYHVTTDKPVTKTDLEKLVTGVKLDDGLAKADVSSYSEDGSDKSQIGLELHSGRNRVVRRMMEELGYKVRKLDRVTFAGLTKKNLPRGKWRYLDEKEVGFLRMQ